MGVESGKYHGVAILGGSWILIAHPFFTEDGDYIAGGNIPGGFSFWEKLHTYARLRLALNWRSEDGGFGVGGAMARVYDTRLVFMFIRNVRVDGMRKTLRERIGG